jgi:UDP-N-acetyl-2-amino-2-deoxyglucuronate dehydrogenase
MKFIIVGTGNMASTFIASMKEIEYSSIVGFVTSNKKNALKLIDENPELASCTIANSISNLKCEFDSAIIATPNSTHHKFAIEAANLGKHIFTEKPLDTTVEAMDAMINAALQNDVKLAVAYQRRMSLDNINVKKLLEDNKLGKVFAADLSVKFFRGQSDYYDSKSYRGTTKIDGGGPFMHQASHNIDIYCWFFGMPEKVVSMYDTFNHNIEVEDHGVALLRYKNKMIGTIIASSTTAPGFLPRLEIHTDKGSLILENDAITHWSIKDVQNPISTNKAKIHDGKSFAVADISGHVALLKDFIIAVKDDRRPAVDGSSAAMATKLVLEIYKNKI